MTTHAEDAKVSERLPLSAEEQALLENGTLTDRAIQAQGPLRRARDRLLAMADSVNPRGKAAKNAEHTYNLTRELYERFLDEDRQYTMAYYRDTSMSLEQAQLDKKAHLAAKLHLKPGMRVLDIGCGWGGMAITLAKLEQVAVLGITLSEEQLALARQRAMKQGVIKADDLARGFAWLRPNDLIWNYVINNYLMGEDPVFKRRAAHRLISAIAANPASRHSTLSRAVHRSCARRPAPGWPNGRPNWKPG